MSSPRPDGHPSSNILRRQTSASIRGTLERTDKSTVMSKIPDMVPVSDLRQTAAGVLQRVKKSRQPIVITQRGRAAAIMIGIEEYERAEHERELLKLLVKGEREIAAGRGHELEDVLAEADRILAK
jgi:prevent-host-death family protein